MLDFEVILRTWRSTEKPPKPKINEHKTVWKCIVQEVNELIKEIPLVTSIRPERSPIPKKSGKPTILSKFTKADSIWLVLSIDIIIEKRTTKQPIIETVFIELIILLDKTSPKLQKERVDDSIV